MNNSNNLNRVLHRAGALTLTLALNTPVAADIGQQPSLSKLSIQIQDLTRQLHKLQAQVVKQNTNTHFAALETSKMTVPRQISTRHGRNKNR